MNTEDAQKTIAPGNAARNAALFSGKAFTPQQGFVKGPPRVLRHQCPTCDKFATLLNFTNALTGTSTNNCQQCIDGFKRRQEEADHALAVATHEAMNREAPVEVPEPVNVVRPAAQLAGCMLCPRTATVFPANGICLCDRCVADQRGGANF